ncbi:hypothetical protein EZ428_07215 [Pedobacter frigiditerrae]|uniref:Glycolipid-binding domain-containing protein n=1 Tax=Pedobacter frigiditerrae TaxID=2530452 RepID=A0A4R0MXE6_9SPHI|nr:putative glycolipid-binding domain-containing protein [Pedobacter frigiditerrae]TCC91547.1 hypothetical protein EZ428_07215 [Pedobacter frigiditerrae]
MDRMPAYNSSNRMKHSSTMKTIIWKGIFYNSLEYFQLSENKDAILVKSKIIGTFKDKTYLVEYSLNIDKEWKVFNFEIEFEINNSKKKINGVKNNNEWKINGKTNTQFTNFDFIDTSLSPFTNTLPIKNLRLNDSQEKEINVIYIDILEQIIEPVKQKYRKNSDINYRYENIPNDFAADIDVDEFGLVIFYPTLFKRMTTIDT